MVEGKEKQKCPECGCENLTYDPSRGEMVCSKCGLVIDSSMIDTTQEWRAFDDSQRSKRVRTGAPLTITKHDRGITTEIGKGRGDSEHFRKKPGILCCRGQDYENNS